MLKFGNAVSCVLILFATATILAQDMPRFEDYPVKVYAGKVHKPKWIRRVSGNEWRDELGKLVAPPEINFAGKYFVAVHSCGTECRYYTLTDLSSGRELDLLKTFDAAEPSSETHYGDPYLTELVTRPTSKMFVAQYHIQSSAKCHERIFILKGEKILSVGSTTRVCAKY